MVVFTVCRNEAGVSEMLRALAAACLLSLSLSSPALGAEDVDLELVFLADSSGSIDSAETAFQRRGHGDALQHPDVIGAIRAGLLGRVAVTYVEWGDMDHQDVVVPWTIIDGAPGAKEFAGRLMAAPRRAFGYNAIGSALAKGRELMLSNDIRGTRMVMDLAGDSANSFGGVPISVARDEAVASGMVINGLPILCRLKECGGRPVSYDLEQAFEQTIIGGPGAFVVTAKDQESFEMAVRRKLILEIAGMTPAAPIRYGFGGEALRQAQNSASGAE
jgi:hypothetical protein